MEVVSRPAVEFPGLNSICMPRLYSPVWKSPLQGWRDMIDRVSENMASATLPPIFFRADDIGAPSKAFDTLCGVFRSHEIPLAMAVIPAWLSEARQEQLFQAAPMDEKLWSWHQHGWRHLNWQKNGRKSEFGSDRNSDCQYEDILRGSTKMERVFGPCFIRVFTAPWNCLSITAMKSLRKLNFKGISTTDTLSPGLRRCHGMLNMPVRIDLHTRDGIDAAADFSLLLEQFSNLSKARGPTGIVIHHQRMTPFAFQFLDRMLYNLRHVVKAQFCSFREMLDSSDEKQAGARLR